MISFISDVVTKHVVGFWASRFHRRANTNMAMLLDPKYFSQTEKIFKVQQDIKEKYKKVKQISQESKTKQIK